MSFSRITVPAVLAVTLIACRPEQVADPAEHVHPVSRAEGAASKSIPAAQLSALRKATVKFHDFEAAVDAEWSVPITACFESAAGGMGFHYARVGLLDGTVNPVEPEALLYEPQKNGKQRLVGVEYIVPWAAWEAAHPGVENPAPPVLYGQVFDSVPAFQVYGLHAWVWRNNPDGMFAAWNPDVSCTFESAVE